MPRSSLEKHSIFLWIVHPYSSRNNLKSTDNKDKYNDFIISITNLNKIH
jgi:hypothetical protein